MAGMETEITTRSLIQVTNSALTASMTSVIKAGGLYYLFAAMSFKIVPKRVTKRHNTGKDRNTDTVPIQLNDVG